jgi:hypothetical protein
MPVNLTNWDSGKMIVLEGVVAPEEVDQLHELIREYPETAVDLSGCEHLHTAVLQLLLISRTPVAALPKSPFWQHFFK